MIVTLQQADKFRDRKTSLANDCAQRPSLEIAAMDWNRHLARRIGRMSEATMDARGSRHRETRASKRPNNVFGFEGW
jgi:hypothetical protein